MSDLLQAVGVGVGLTLALVLMAGISEGNELATIPDALKGAAMSFLIAGILSMAFMGLAGLFSAAQKQLGPERGHAE